MARRHRAAGHIRTTKMTLPILREDAPLRAGVFKQVALTKGITNDPATVGHLTVAPLISQRRQLFFIFPVRERSLQRRTKFLSNDLPAIEIKLHSAYLVTDILANERWVSCGLGEVTIFGAASN